MARELGAVGCLLLTGVAIFGSGAACKSREDERAQGKQLFASACARCHGDNGAGGVAITPGAPVPRNLRDHAFHASRTDEQLKQVVASGKAPGMPPFAAVFDDGQLRAVVAFVRSLDSENR